jgi:hypothetical protein
MPSDFDKANAKIRTTLHTFAQWVEALLAPFTAQGRVFADTFTTVLHQLMTTMATVIDIHERAQLRLEMEQLIRGHRLLDSDPTDAPDDRETPRHQ